MVDTYYPWVGVLWQGGCNSTVPYAFCSNNPVNRVDPDGLSDFVWNPEANGGAGGYVWTSYRGIDLNGNRMERSSFFHETPGSKGYVHAGGGYYIDKATGEAVTWDVVHSYVESITPTCNTSNASSETVKLLLEILAQGNNLRPLKGYGLTYVQYGYNGEWYSCLLDIIISDSEMGVLYNGQGVTPISGIDIDKAITYLNANAGASWRDARGECARSVIKALVNGGAEYRVINKYAKDFGPTLLDMGFNPVNVSSLNAYTAQRGDVAILQAWGNHTSGHMEMYNGTQWVSDYFQGNDFWPWAGSRNATDLPGFTIYRLP